MAFIKANRKQLLLAGPLAVTVAVAALTVTACGGGGGSATAASAGTSSPGQWSTAEVSQFTAAANAGGAISDESCVITYIKRDMSFTNAMDAVSVDPASDSSMSAAQIKTALVGKYGGAVGDAIDAQLEQAASDANSNCAGASSSAAPSTPATPATPAATSESSCTVDCQNPVASGESGWLAQVQGALQNVQQDLSSISSDSSGDPSELTVDGAQLDQDATAALDPNDDPPPADNADWVTAMNEYVTAGEDYSDDNMNSQDNNPAAASAAIAAGNSALASFNAANGGVLDGTIQS
jgi:hypothetical protein